MRIDVVLRYVGQVMMFIAAFMLLSAGISYLSGMDSAFYPLLLSALLTALLACVGTGLRTSLTTCLSVHLCTCCLEGGVELVHGSVNGSEVL